MRLPTPEGMGYALSSRGGEGGAKARGALGVPTFRKSGERMGHPTRWVIQTERSARAKARFIPRTLSLA